MEKLLHRILDKIGTLDEKVLQNRVRLEKK